VAIVNGTRGVSANTVLRLAKVFGTTPNFWLNLQNAYDLDTARSDVGELEMLGLVENSN
jgi:antitoxin HigA-1